MEQRNIWIDYAKAIGIILVVFGHILRGLHSSGIEVPIEVYRITDSVIYSFHMPLFFFLSGLLFYSSLEKRGAGDLVLSKVDTIFYPYVVWSILQGVLEASMSSYTNGNVGYVEVFSLLWAPRAQFWFLYTLFFFFCIAAAIYSYVAKSATFVILALSAAAYIFQDAFPSVRLLSFLTNNFIYFVLGIAFSLYVNTEKLANWAVVTGLGLSFIAGQYVFHGVFDLIYKDKGVASIVLACVSIAFVSSLCTWVAHKRCYKWFAFLGTASMAIYVMHVMAGSGVRIFLKSIMGVDSLLVHLTVGTLVGVLMPTLALIFINRYRIPFVFSAPISRYLRRLTRGRPLKPMDDCGETPLK